MMGAYMDTFLNFLQRTTKTDIRYILRGGGWLFVAQGTVFLLSLALVWVFANVLDPEAYGQYRFMTAVLGILAISSLPGMSTAIVRAVARGTSGIIPAAIKTRVRWSLLGSTAAVVGAGYYAWQENLELASLFLLLAVALPFYQSFAVAMHYHNGRTDYRQYTLVAIIRRGVVVATTILAIVISRDVFIILLTFLAATALSHYLLYRYSIARFPLSEKTDTETIPYGKQLSLAGVITATGNQLDKVLLWYLATPAAVAVYAITVSLPREVASALGNIGILALPKMANRSIAVLRANLLRKIGWYFALTIPTAVGFALIMPTVFAWFFPQYLSHVFLAQLASLLIALTPVTLLTQYVNATAHLRALYITQIVLPLTVLGLYALLIPLYGALGAVIALVCKKLVGFLLLLGFFVFDRRSDEQLLTPE
ncbi:hypothetical protein CL655_02025 [bacterium]|nr:hypothetical protein [bacterium]